MKVAIIRARLFHISGKRVEGVAPKVLVKP